MDFRRLGPSLRRFQSDGETVRYAWEFWYFCPDLHISHKEQWWFQNPAAEVLYTCRCVCLFFPEIESALKTR